MEMFDVRAPGVPAYINIDTICEVYVYAGCVLLVDISKESWSIDRDIQVVLRELRKKLTFLQITDVDDQVMYINTEVICSVFSVNDEPGTRILYTNGVERRVAETCLSVIGKLSL